MPAAVQVMPYLKLRQELSALSREQIAMRLEAGHLLTALDIFKVMLDHAHEQHLGTRMLWETRSDAPVPWWLDLSLTVPYEQAHLDADWGHPESTLITGCSQANGMPFESIDSLRHTFSKKSLPLTAPTSVLPGLEFQPFRFATYLRN